MSYLLDTDIFIDYLDGDLVTRQLINPLARQGLAISTVTYMEAYQGILRDHNRAFALVRFEGFLVDVPVIPISLEIARRCAELREDLRRRGRRVRPRALDLLTAATALEHGYTLVTRNRADDDDIPDLALV
ncbi:MAG: type II toxin-antitoxin system VapC family toxin [Thermomicrobiales bacterium]